MKPALIWLAFSVPVDIYRRFHGRGCHLVGRAKNSDGLGRVIVSVQNGSYISFHGQQNIRIS